MNVTEYELALLLVKFESEPCVALRSSIAKPLTSSEIPMDTTTVDPADTAVGVTVATGGVAS